MLTSTPSSKVLNNIHKYGRFYMAALLMLVLMALLLLSAHAKAGPRAPATPTASSRPEIVRRARNLTRCYAQYLGLPAGTARRLGRCTRQHLLAYNALLAGAPDKAAALEQQYQQCVLPILTPGQFNAFVWLREQQPATPATSVAHR